MAQVSVVGASEALSIHLQFMNDAAHLLAMVAPASSSHIMATRDDIMFANEMEASDEHRQHVCGGCGSIKIPLWTLEARREPRATKTKARKQKARPTNSQSTDICTCCGRKTRQSILKPKPQRIDKKAFITSQQSIVKSTPVVSSKEAEPKVSATAATSANASSKKRAKSRKQGGLQALLAKNKEAQNSSKGFGLDLMDLMK